MRARWLMVVLALGAATLSSCYGPCSCPAINEGAFRGMSLQQKLDAALPSGTNYDVDVFPNEVRVRYVRDGKKIELVYARPSTR